MANTDPWRTSLTAFRIGLPIFIIPYMFIYGPQLLGYLGPVQVALSSLTATAGVLILSVTCIGWLFVPLNILERTAAGIAALFLMFSGWRTDLIGLSIFTLVAAIAWWRYHGKTTRGESVLGISPDMVVDDSTVGQRNACD